METGGAGEKDITLEKPQDALKRLTRELSGYLDRDSTTVEQEIPPEALENVHRRIVERIGNETDLGHEFEGVLPLEELLAPVPSIDMVPLSDIGGQTIPIKKLSPTQHTIGNLLRKVFTGKEARAAYDPKRKIIELPVTPDKNVSSTVTNMASGNTLELLGFSLGHEILHAIQVGTTEPPSFTHAFLESSRLRRAHPYLSGLEAATLARIPVDTVILSETQAHLLNAACGIYNSEAEVVKDQLAAHQTNIPEGLELRIGDINISEYDFDGYLNVEDWMTRKINEYLPKSFQEDKAVKTKITMAYRQLTTLKELGLSHRDIASLINNNFQTIRDGSSWDSENYSFRFLQEKVDELAHHQEISNTAFSGLINKAENDKKQRGMQLRKIALEELVNSIKALN